MDRGAWRASVRGGCKELDMIERLTPTHTALGSSQTLGGASAQFPPDLTAPLPRASCGPGSLCSGSAQLQRLHGEAG